MSPVVEIIGAGGFIKPADGDRYRAYLRGDRVMVSDEDARRYAEAGFAQPVDVTVAEHAEEEAPQPGAIPVTDLDLAEGGTSVAELRKFANARRINLQGATRRPEIAAAIEDALTNPDDEDGG